MEITIEKGGGFTGQTERLGPVNTDELPRDVARKLGDLVTAMNFFSLPTTIAKPGGADVVEYATQVADDGHSHTVYSNSLSDKTYERQLSDLVDLLEKSGAKFAVVHLDFTPKNVAQASLYTLTGDGITLDYSTFANLNKGERVLGYSDGHHSLDFYDKDVRTVDIADLGGRCVSVTLEDGGEPWRSTTATLVIPEVSFSGGDTAWSFPVETLLIITSPATSREGRTYRVIKLVGEARR
jgi:hypothetical protein